ncbi:MAG: LacI family transcriptional regulator [Gammaproteobacteria bacterium]|nr:LacI family transcriptional regulator [Gammaproteobacteria bacterium]MDH4312324.1 LacI family transcriptional regulator [Gammaproteobacteria bacterium]MDH5272675.1 LacI family transcriptional regulator [Gammaproteobacteria bacterium]
MRRSELERRAAAAASGSAVTLEMVAREAGVSPSTVSRILNGTARVRDSKVRAVEAAIAKLQFLPNPVARSLAGGKSMSVGVVTQAIDSPFYGVSLAGIEKGLLRAGYSPLFVSGHWREGDERSCVDHLLSRRVEGIILMTSRLPDEELVNLARSVPLVVTGRRVDGDRVYCVDVDSTLGARVATDYLIGQGHRRIAFISGPPDHPDALQRLDGYRAALAAGRIPFRSKLVAAGDYLEAGGQAAINALLDARVEFTAVFAANDQTAYGAMLALHRRGLKVPQDVSVVGFDDLPTSAFIVPPLTTVHRYTDEIGEGAAEAIVDLIERRTPHARVSAPTLAIRESTRPWRD